MCSRERPRANTSVPSSGKGTLMPTVQTISNGSMIVAYVAAQSAVVLLGILPTRWR